MIEALQKLPPTLIERFLATRDAQACAIPEPLAQYILQLNDAANIFRKNTSISDSAAELQKIYPNLSFSTCRERVYDAVSYLHAGSSVTAEAWNNFFADQYMNLRDVALVAHDLGIVVKCLEKARECRIAAASSSVDPRLLKFKPQVVSPDVQLERMGIKRSGLLAAYSKSLDIIGKQDIPESEKERMRDEVSRELGIETVQNESI